MTLPNPFRPGAGHMPPYLAGRDAEVSRFLELLGQTPILDNLVLTGLRGVGKTVLLETLRPLAVDAGWLWVGTDLSESACATERAMAVRLLTDLAVATSTIRLSLGNQHVGMGFGQRIEPVEGSLDYRQLLRIYEATPGLVADKIKAVLGIAGDVVAKAGFKGIVFAYDEAQNLGDAGDRNEYPLSVLLDVFQSLQRQEKPLLLILTGLPTLFPKLVEARTFAERMFDVIVLDRLSRDDTVEAVRRPIDKTKSPLHPDDGALETIWRYSAGYPYFIQFICREAFDLWIRCLDEGTPPSIPADDIVRKLDQSFFAGRWSRVTDAQRDLLIAVAHLPTCEDVFTIQEIVEQSKAEGRSFSPSHANQVLAKLADAGLVYKNRHGRYALAVPLLNRFILRMLEDEQHSIDAQQ